MSLRIFDGGSDNSITSDWLNWRPTVELLRKSKVKPEYGWEMANEGIGTFSAEQTAVIIKYLESTSAAKEAWVQEFIAFLKKCEDGFYLKP